jgi:hypothetical protein
MTEQKTNPKATTRNIFLTTISVVVVALLAVLIGGKLFAPNAIAKQVDNDLSQIAKTIEDALNNESVLSYSSNPYDYVVDNVAYDHIVSLGAETLPWLEKALKSSQRNGLVEYIIAIAIEDIAQTNIREEADVAWENAKEFLDQWDTFLADVPTKTQSILRSSASDSQKIDQLKSFGILTLPTLSEMPEKMNASSSLREYATQLLRTADPAFKSNGDLQTKDIVACVQNDLQAFVNYAKNVDG